MIIRVNFVLVRAMRNRGFRMKVRKKNIHSASGPKLPSATPSSSTQPAACPRSSLVPKNSIYAVEIEALSSWDAEPVRKRPVLWSPNALRFTVKVVR